MMKRTVPPNSMAVVALLVGLGGSVLAGEPTRPARGTMNVAPLQHFQGLAFSVPDGFKQRDERSDKTPSLIPGGAPTTESFRSYQNATGDGLYLFHWDGMPTRDRGPMAAAESWEARIDGVTARVTLTSMFFGRQQKVLVAHFGAPSEAEHRYLIYTTLTDKAAFGALLSSIRFEHAAAASPPPRK